MFELSKKTHTMKLGHNSKYLIINVKTVRLPKSEIINMRKYLNKKHKKSKIKT